MHKKLMGLPAYVWLGAAVAGLFLGLYLRSRSSGTSTANTGTAVPVETSTDTSSFPVAGVAAGGTLAPASPGLDPATVAALLGGDASGGGTSSPTIADAVNNLAATISQGGLAATNIASSGGSGSSAAGKGVVSTPKEASTPQAPPVVKQLKNGAKLTILPNGREIEQAPGKKPYVVKR